MHVTKVVYIFANIPEQLSLHFYDFSTIFNRIYKFTGKSRKYKNTDCKGVPGILTEPPGNLKLFAQGSLAGVGDRGGGGGGFPGEEGLAGGWDGAQGRELTELYLRMGDAVDGGGRSRVGGGAQGAAAAAAADDGAPVWEEGQEPAGELHGAMRKLVRGLIGGGEGRSKEFRGGRRPAAALLATAVLGGDGGGRCLAVELHGVKEVPFRGSIWAEGHRG